MEPRDTASSPPNWTRGWAKTLILLLMLDLSLGDVQKKSVYIAGFFPLTPDPQGRLGLGVLPAVHLALNHINDNPRVLKGYHLNIIYNDTKCDAAVGMKAFFDMMYKSPTKVILFGAACTQVTDPVAKTSRIWYLTQLSYADTHPMFTSQNYPYFFRMVPSENEFNSPRIHLLKLFNWTQVGTLYQNKPRYALAHNKLLNDLEEAGVTILDSQSFAEEVKTHLIKLKEKDARIILGNFDESWARNIFCEVFRLGLYGRKYQWLIVGMYEDHWWSKSDKTVACSRSQIAQALEGTISTDLLPLRTDSMKTVSYMTPTDYLGQYDKLRGKNRYSRFHGYAYDGIWTIALALQAVAKKLQEQADGRGLEDFEYRNAEWGDMFATALNATSFEGVTGPVWFINNNRKGYVLLKQFQGGREVKIGEYDGVQNVLDLKRWNKIKWGGSGPPLDRTLSILERMRVNLPIYSVLASIASCGIVIAIFFLAINIRFRNQRNIKMSSPYLNNLIIIGCILTYTSVILLGLDSELTSEDSLRYVCSMRAWILMSGFTLAFGSMFSKTWRVHTIFTDIKLNRKAITDFQLISVVAVLLGIDVAIMVTWQIVDPFYRETKKLPPVPHPTNQDSQIVPVMEYCKSDRMTLFLGAIYVYKGLLMIIGCFLAWETRHVSIPALNDSKYIGMSVYNVVIMCVIGAAISFILSDQPNTSFIMVSVFIIFCTTTTLCLVFVPKKWKNKFDTVGGNGKGYLSINSRAVFLAENQCANMCHSQLIDLQKNPHGMDARVRITFQASMRKRRNSDENTQEKMKELHEENQLFRRTLKEKDIEIRSLIRQLGDDVCDILQERLRFPRVVEIIRREGGSSSDDDDTSSMSSSQDEETNVSLSTDKERSRTQYLLINSFTPQSDRKSVSTVELELSSSVGRESPQETESIPLTDLKVRRDSGAAGQSSEQQGIQVSENPYK